MHFKSNSMLGFTQHLQSDSQSFKCEVSKTSVGTCGKLICTFVLVVLNLRVPSHNKDFTTTFYP